MKIIVDNVPKNEVPIYDLEGVALVFREDGSFEERGAVRDRLKAEMCDPKNIKSGLSVIDSSAIREIIISLKNGKIGVMIV